MGHVGKVCNSIGEGNLLLLSPSLNLELKPSIQQCLLLVSSLGHLKAMRPYLALVLEDQTYSIGIFSLGPLSGYEHTVFIAERKCMIRRCVHSLR